ncbi:MAG TPA: hypothetical protein VNO70_15785 [Blastocatellia bacterium]|nr:hypothetical protein [Blastocatellia bacterium]
MPKEYNRVPLMERYKEEEGYYGFRLPVDVPRFGLCKRDSLIAFREDPKPGELVMTSTAYSDTGLVLGRFMRQIGDKVFIEALDGEEYSFVPVDLVVIKMAVVKVRTSANRRKRMIVHFGGDGAGTT